MKPMTAVLLLTIWTTGCTGIEPSADAIPEFAGGEDTEVRATLEPDVVADLVELDMLTETQSPPDVDPSTILPGSSCLEVNPEKISFGGVKVGNLKTVPVTLTVCGDAPLRIDGIYLAEGASQAFSLDVSSLPVPPTVEQPLLLHPGEAVEVNVGFMMETHSTINDDGDYVVEEGELVVHSSTVPKYTSVPLSGVATAGSCPTAIIKCSEGDDVQPYTVLHLHGDESYDPKGGIAKWDWDVEPPEGAQGIFVPSNSFPNPTFETNVSGVYRFLLTVWDENGVPSCFPAEYEVVVADAMAVQVELTWNVPSRSEETPPRLAADLDLHLAHPWAAGPDLDGNGASDGWFDIPFDCFWANDSPNWGSYDPAIDDNPSLEQSPDGETVTLDIPENVIYRVGVHYYQQSGEPADATVRIYFYNQLVFETPAVQLNPLDMWEVLTIEWPTGKVVVAEDDEGGWRMTAGYQNPYFIPW